MYSEGGGAPAQKNAPGERWRGRLPEKSHSSLSRQLCGNSTAVQQDLRAQRCISSWEGLREGRGLNRKRAPISSPRPGGRTGRHRSRAAACLAARTAAGHPAAAASPAHPLYSPRRCERRRLRGPRLRRLRRLRRHRRRDRRRRPHGRPCRCCRPCHSSCRCRCHTRSGRGHRRDGSPG